MTRSSVTLLSRNFSSTSSNTSILKPILDSCEIEGATKGSGENTVYTGCPTIIPNLVEITKTLKNIKREEYIFETNKVSLLEHSYVAVQNITTDFSLPIKWLGLNRFLKIIGSPKLHLVEWLLSFPFGSDIECLSVTDGVARLMDSDPVKLSRVNTKQLTSEDAEVTTYWDMESVYNVLTSQPDFTPTGVLLTHFLAQTLVDLGGKSHMLPGTVNHGRVVSFESGSVAVWEYRLGMGGGSLNGGALNNVVGYLTWKAQFSAIKQMHLEQEFWTFAAEFCECTSPQQLLTLLNTYKQKWSAKPQLIGILNRLADPVRYILTGYAHTMGVNPTGSLKDKYFLKNPR